MLMPPSTPSPKYLGCSYYSLVEAVVLGIIFTSWPQRLFEEKPMLIEYGCQKFDMQSHV